MTARRDDCHIGMGTKRSSTLLLGTASVIAPRRPEIHPDAPTPAASLPSGNVLPQYQFCIKPPAIPDPKYRSVNLVAPMLLANTIPNDHNPTMLRLRCPKPLCIKVDVISVYQRPSCMLRGERTQLLRKSDVHWLDRLLPSSAFI